MVSPEPAPSVAVITVNYASEKVLPSFLDSIHAATTHPVVVAVADNAASAEARSLAEKHGVGYLRLPENRGYGGAINAAALELDPGIRWIVVSNPDIEFAPGAIDALIATGDADESIGTVGPLIRNSDGSIYPSARSVPSLRTGIGHALFANLWLSNPWTRAYRNEFEGTPSPREAGWLSGACVAVRRTVFDSLGGFDTGFFMYFEDVDLGYRVTKSGQKNVYQPDAEVIHSGAHSTTASSELMLKAHHDSARRFLSKKYSRWFLWPLRWMLNLGLSARAWLLARRLPGHH